jgi:hypothetical protein
MDVKGKVLRADEKGAYVVFSVPKETTTQYLTVYTSNFNYPHGIVNNGHPGIETFNGGGGRQKAYVYVRGKDGEFNNKDDHELAIRNGKNDTLILNSDVYREVKIEFDDQDVYLSIEKVVLSKYPVVSSSVIFLFPILLILFVAIWKKIVFDDFCKKALQRPIVLLIVIVVVQIFSILYWTDQRKDFFGDEIGSILNATNLIDEYDAGNIGSMTWGKSIKEKWLPSNYFFNVLSVQPKERFRYDIVSASSKEDIFHPPFYNYQLHTIFSLFTNAFNKWIGIIPNLIWFILTAFLLYFASKSLLNDRTALLPVILWGFSSGAISDTYLMRDYMSATVFSTALLFLSYRFIDRENIRIKDCFLLAVVVCLSLLSHYSISVYVFLVAGVLFCYFAYKKLYKVLRNLIIGVSVGFACTQLLWSSFFPAIFRQAGNREIWPISKILMFFVDRIGEELFYLWDKTLILLIVLALVVLFVKVARYMSAKNMLAITETKIVIKAKLLNFRDLIDGNLVKVIILFVPIAYMFIVARTITQVEARYIFCIYPAVALLSIVILDRFSGLFLSQNIKNIVLPAIILSLVLFTFGYKKRYLEYFYPVDTSAVAKTYADSKFIAVSLREGWLPINILSFAAQNNAQGYVLYVENEEDIEQKLVKPLSQIKNSEEVVIYIAIARSDTDWMAYWRPQLLKRQVVRDKVFEVIEKSGFREPKFLLSGFCFEAYRVKRKGTD